MEYTKKFVMIPEQDLVRLRRQRQPVVNNNANLFKRLKQKMHQTLSRNDISEEEKALLHGQQQYEYMDQSQQQQLMKKPAVVSEGGVAADSYKDIVLKVIVNSLYKVYGARLTTLISYLCQPSSSLSWNGKGEIIINNGQLIPGSSLLTLLEDVLHQGPTRHPEGYLEFAHILKQIGVPDYLVGETTGIYKTFHSSASDVGDSPFHGFSSSEIASSTPAGSYLRYQLENKSTSEPPQLHTFDQFDSTPPREYSLRSKRDLISSAPDIDVGGDVPLLDKKKKTKARSSSVLEAVKKRVQYGKGIKWQRF